MLVAARRSAGTCRRDRSASPHGVVSHASGRKATFGELAQDAAAMPVPSASTPRTVEVRVHRQARAARGRGREVERHAMFTQDVQLPAC
jgi:isoquinoline 1-oxidoreductase beta subunit